MTEVKDQIIGPPIFAAKELKKAEENWQHNWLYSVVPVGEQKEDWSVNSSTGFQERTVNYPLGAYLTGYCRNCRKAFSQPIPCDSGKYVETQMDIPVFGCTPPPKY